MRSGQPGTTTPAAEVIGITSNGIWLLLDQEEHFLPFGQFPWFRDAPVRAILEVERPRPHRLYWPALGVDLRVESITHPEKRPLVSGPRA